MVTKLQKAILMVSILSLIAIASFGIVSAYDCSAAPSSCSVSGNDLVCDLTGNADRVTVDNFASAANMNLDGSPFIYTYKNNYGRGSILYKINTIPDTGANNIFLSF